MASILIKWAFFSTHLGPRLKSYLTDGLGFAFPGPDLRKFPEDLDSMSFNSYKKENETVFYGLHNNVTFDQKIQN